MMDPTRPLPSNGSRPNGDRQAKISCRNIWKVYGQDPDSYFSEGRGNVEDPGALGDRLRAERHVVAADNVSFDVYVGEIFIIMGLSGSGKSTMVRCLSRLVEPTAGEVLLDGSDLLKASEKELIEIRRHKMGMVFQNFGLLPHLSVLENVAFPLRVQGLDTRERLARAQEMVELVGLDGRENSFPNQLSGGQQQRVGIARSLAVEPELWFLDEPFSALDPLIRRQMQDEFIRLQTMLHKTIVFITHDFLEGLRLADRMAIMKDGKVVQIGTPSQIVLNPADDYVAEFTSEVPLVRVITVEDIMEPYEGRLDPQDACHTTMSLHEILPYFARQPDGFAVTNDSNEVIGQITAVRVLAALAGDEGRARE